MDNLYCELRENGYSKIAGVDEVGRGPLAGPVVACAIILPDEFNIKLNDSKKLSSKKRDELFKLILSNAVDIGIGIIGPKVIDCINIRQATLMAMYDAVQSFRISPDYIIIDGLDTIPNIDIKQIPIVKADTKITVVQAASIVAKVFRDQLMDLSSNYFPQYNFIAHKGYPTYEHRKAVSKFGYSPYHRISFKFNIIST